MPGRRGSGVRAGGHPLALRRRAVGLSQEELARRTGISRQALSAIEAGRHSPRVGVALALADALGCGVEELFAKDEAAPAALVEAVGFPRGGAARAALACVAGREVAWPLDLLAAPGSPTGAADALVEAAPARPAVASVAQGPVPSRWGGPFGPAASLEASRVRVLRRLRRGGLSLFVSGCDPALGILSAHVRRRGSVEAWWWPTGNARARSLLGAGHAHLAGVHGAVENEAAAGAAEAGTVARFVLGRFEMGLVTAPGNPRRVRGPQDLGRAGVRLVNREQGAGARVLLDRLLAAAGVDPAAVAGYGHEVASHAAVAAAVALGAADVGVAPVAVAASQGLEAVPVGWERSELWVAREALEDPAVSVALEALCSQAFARELSAVGGYDTTETGRRVA
jgi:putative molybdopterin biosynthesis protein